jgi:hypothetical protein
MEFTSRTAWLSYYGEPDNEAERYFYAAACEVLNHSGRLYCARLPYDNEAFEKMPGIKYELKFEKNYINNTNYYELSAGDSELKNAYVIKGGKDPALFDLSYINELRADEIKVTKNTFLIVDTTGATYKKITEDFRKGTEREVIGIVPVVTTAANALYAQSMIKVDLANISSYEVISDKSLKTLKTDKFSNNGLQSSDLVKLLNTNEQIV